MIADIQADTLEVCLDCPNDKPVAPISVHFP